MSDFSDFEFELHRIPFEILEVFLYKSVTFLGSRPVILIYPFIHSTHSIVSRYVVVGREKKRYVVVATAWHRLQYRKCRQVGRAGDQRADDSPGVHWVRNCPRPGPNRTKCLAWWEQPLNLSQPRTASATCCWNSELEVHKLRTMSHWLFGGLAS